MMMKKTAFVLSVLFSALLFCSCGKEEPHRTVVELEGPAGLTCEISGNKVTRSKFRIIPGKYAMGFSAPGYRTEYHNVTVPETESFSYKVELAPVRASVLINSTPAGASVVMDGQSMGITPLVIRDMAAGEYRAELSMRGYATIPLSWKVDSERPLALNAELDSNQGSLLLTSTPSRAKVIVDGQEIGVTPLTLERAEGKYVLRLERPDCTPVERNILISKKQKSRLHLKLGQKPGAFQITSRPAGAEIFINGTKRGVTPFTVQALEPGEYTLTLSLDGYDPEESRIKVLPGVTDRKNFTLSKSTGSAVLNITPAGIQVFLNDKFLGVTRSVVEGAESTVNLTVNNLKPGTYTVTMVHELGDPQRQSFSFRVRKNQNSVKSWTMWIANCEITYNNGTVEKGFLRSARPDHVVFSPEPGISLQVRRSSIQNLIMLDRKNNKSK